MRRLFLRCSFFFFLAVVSCLVGCRSARSGESEGTDSSDLLSDRVGSDFKSENTTDTYYFESETSIVGDDSSVNDNTLSGDTASEVTRMPSTDVAMRPTSDIETQTSDESRDSASDTVTTDQANSTKTATDTGIDTNTEFATEGETVLASDTWDTENEIPEGVAASLFPLAVGNSWTYSLADYSDVTDCDTSMDYFTASILETRTLGELEAFELEMICFSNNTYLAYDGENVVHWATDDTWRISLASPVIDSTSWEYGRSHVFTWQYEPFITVPAGTFEHCWTRIQTTEEFSTYCPNVGKVREVRANNFDAVLESFEIVEF